MVCTLQTAGLPIQSAMAFEEKSKQQVFQSKRKYPLSNPLP